MNNFLKIQTQVLKSIDASPLKDREIGLLWADRYGGTSRNLAQRVFQWRCHGLPLSIIALVELMDILGYELTIAEKKDWTMIFTTELLKSIYNDFLDAVNSSMLESLISSVDKLTSSEKAIIDLYYAAIRSGSAPTDEMFESTAKALNIKERLNND